MHKVFLEVGEQSRLFILLNFLEILKYKIKFIQSLDETNYDDLYFIPVKIPFIEALADPDCITNQEVINAYQQSNAKILFDLSTESITFSDYTSKLLLSFHQILRHADIDPERVYLVCANAHSAKHYPEWISQHGLEDYQIKMLGYHFYLYEYFWETKRCDWLQSVKESILENSRATVTKGTRRSKHFICLNLRPRRHRTAVVLHLLERNFLEKGHVTYFGDEFADHDSVDKNYDTVSFIEKLSSGSRLLPFLDKLNNLAPLTLDKNSQEMRNDLWNRMPGQVEFLIPEGDNVQTNGIDSYFEIVTETWFTNNANLYITEKTIRSFLRLQPFIHVGAPHLLAFLETKGFNTFSPYIDESYDNIEDPAERMEAILKEIDRLCTMSLDEIHNLYCALWPRLLHNFNHFQNSTNKIAEEEISNILNSLV